MEGWGWERHWVIGVGVELGGGGAGWRWMEFEVEGVLEIGGVGYWGVGVGDEWSLRGGSGVGAGAGVRDGLWGEVRGGSVGDGWSLMEFGGSWSLGRGVGNWSLGSKVGVRE